MEELIHRIFQKDKILIYNGNYHDELNRSEESVSIFLNNPLQWWNMHYNKHKTDEL